MMATDVFAAIADPTRRAVLDLLTRGPRNAGGIAAEFPRLTQPGVSRHLRVLRKAKLVEVAVRAGARADCFGGALAVFFFLRLRRIFLVLRS